MLTVGLVVSGAFRVIRQHPAAVAVWGLAHLAGAVLGTLAIRSALHMQAAADVGDADAMMATFASGFGLFFLLQLLVYLLMIVVFTAAMRAVLRPREGGLAFIRFGMDEARMIALTIILVGAFYAALLLLIVLSGILFGTMFIASGGAGGGSGGIFGTVVIALVIGFALLAFAIWLYVRLSLAYPLTLLRGKIVIGESWRLTRGHALPLFGAYLLIFLFVVAISAVAAAVTSAAYFAELMRIFEDSEGALVAADNQLRRMSEINAVTVLGWVLNAIGGGLMTALLAGSAATAARALTGDELLAREFA